MGKNSNKKKRKRLGIQPTPLPITAPKIKTPWYKTLWGAIVGFSVLITIVVSLVQLWPSNKTKIEKYEEQTFEQGDLKGSNISNTTSNFTICEVPPIFLSPYLKDSFPIIKGILMKNAKKEVPLMIESGKRAFEINLDQLYKGVKMTMPLSKECGQSEIILGAKDGRLYMSVEFRDFVDEQSIGWMYFNHWKIYKNNKIEYNATDTSLEVRDHQHHIVFNVKYYPSTAINPRCWIQFGGYFINTSSVVVVSNDTINRKNEGEYCFPKTDSNWKKNASKKIEIIMSIF